MTQPQANQTPTLTTREAAEMWGIPLTTIQNWVHLSPRGGIKRKPLPPGSYRRTLDGTWLISEYGMEFKTRRKADKTLAQLYREDEEYD